MLISDLRTVGEKLHGIRKRMGLTQAMVAEHAGISDRAYADIERGSVNMRLETIVRICDALHITPDEILTEDVSVPTMRKEELLARLEACPAKDKETALALLSVFLKSLS